MPWIGKVDFCQERAGSPIDSLGGSHDPSRELLARELSKNDVSRSLSEFNASRILLGNIHVHAHCICLSDVKQIIYLCIKNAIV